jgi:copper resistance protein C
MKGPSVLPLHRAHRRLLRHTRPSASPRRSAPFRAVHLPAVRTAGVLVAGALALAGAFTSVVTGAAPASAHAVLVKATPADGAVLRAAPTSVVLQFDDPISTSFATLTVTGPDGSTVSPGKASVSGTTVSAALDDGLEPGRYRTVFRVVSEDGHPVNGQLTFTVKLPGGTGSPSTTSGAPATGTTSGGATTSSGAASPGSPSTTAGGSSWLADNLLPLTGALLLVVIGVGALLWDRLRH